MNGGPVDKDKDEAIPAVEAPPFCQLVSALLATSCARPHL